MRTVIEVAAVAVALVSSLFLTWACLNEQYPLGPQPLWQRFMWRWHKVVTPIYLGYALLVAEFYVLLVFGMDHYLAAIGLVIGTSVLIPVVLLHLLLLWRELLYGESTFAAIVVGALELTMISYVCWATPFYYDKVYWCMVVVFPAQRADLFVIGLMPYVCAITMVIAEARHRRRSQLDARMIMARFE